MNIQKLSNISFAGSIKVNGKINIFKKDDKLTTGTDIINNRRAIKKLFSGSNITIDNSKEINPNGNAETDGYYYRGAVEIDPDRVDTISKDKIYLTSLDNTVKAQILYNEDNDQLRHLIAINGYQTAVAAKTGIVIDID